ncbi:MAG: GLUG motif-containing protein [Acholeplasma sp.]|nr:GLUG motif-containing protein [Acholeplasma sp.]
MKSTKLFKQKKTLFSSFFLGLLFVVAGCSGTSGLKQNVTPIYQGMAVEKLNTRSLIRIANDSSEEGLDAEVLISEELIEDIDKIIDIDVETNSEVNYFVEKSETFLIALNIYNPSQYEILSFTINGYKYANNMFALGSTLTKVLVSTTAGNDSGIFDYTIDAIKYIDGTDIKDVRMEGERTIKTAVRYDFEPSAEIRKEVIGTNSINLEIYTTDYDGLIKEESLFSVFLSDGIEIIEEIKLAKGLNNIEILNLKMNKPYQYAIKATYDIYDGNGVVLKTLDKRTVNTLKGLVFETVEASKETVNFELKYISKDITLESIKLYDFVSLEHVLTIDNNETEFSNLLSDHKYLMKAEYSYTVKDSLVIDNEIVEIGTLKKATPVLTINDLTIGQEEINFDLLIIDADQVGDIATVNLKKNDTVVQILSTSAGAVSFTNLLSNNDYVIEINYGYDLNDGLGHKTVEVTRLFKTLSKAVPTVDIFDVSSTQDSILFDIDVLDNDQVGSISAIELFNGTKLVQSFDLSYSEQPNQFVFAELLSNTEYTIKVTYTYDLNDGSGVQTIVTTKVERTLTKEVPTINLVAKTSTQSQIAFEVVIIDNDQVGSVNSVKLYKAGALQENVAVKGENGLYTFTNLLSNNQYEVRVTYTYNLNDGQGSKTLESSINITTLTKATPSVDIFDVSSAQDSILFDIDVLDNDQVGSISAIELFKATKLAQSYDMSYSEHPNQFVFSDLLSNTEYTIRVTYTYDLNDGGGVKTLYTTKTITTLAKEVPTLEVLAKSSTQAQVQFEIAVIDNDQVGSIHTIKLYKAGVIQDKVALQGANGFFTFSDLLSNNEYEVKVTYTYNLNDGLGSKTLEKTLMLRTLTKAVPTVDIFDVSSSQDSIMFDIEVLDNDQVGRISAIELFKATKLAQSYDMSYSEHPDQFVFSDLLSNTEYTIRVTYTYDLNDGSGEQLLITSYKFPTLAEEVTITEISILNTTYPKIGEEIHIRVMLDNPSNLVIRTFIVNGKSISVVGGNVQTSAIIKFIPVDFAGGVYEIRIDAITYKSFDKDLRQNISSEFSDNIIVLGEIKAVRLYNENSNIISLDQPNNYIYLELDNPTGYTLSKMTLVSSMFGEMVYIENEITKIDDNTFGVEWRGYSNIVSYSITLKNIEYGISGQEQSSKSFSNIESVFTNVYELAHRTIENKEQLKNLQDGYIYELTNDIDLIKEKWIPYDFNGVIFGNGFSIKNMSIVFENESNLYQPYGLFSTFSGVINGVKIIDIYMSIKTIGDVYAGAFAGYAGYASIENCSVTGIIIVDANGITGGLVGQGSTVTITNSNNSGSVSGNYNTGGLVGNSNTVTITNSYNSGSVSGNYNTGGLVGNGSSVTIINSYNSGTVTGNEQTGGLVGFNGNTLTITNSYNGGSVSGNYNTGGLVGYNGNTLTITNSYNSGRVSGEKQIGGLVGQSVSTLTIINSYNSGTVTGNEQTGGLVGFNGNALTITNSYNSGSVSGNFSTGGLVGYNGNTLTITNSYNSGRVSGQSGIGGLIGNNGNTIIITNSYNGGEVKEYDFVVPGNQYGEFLIDKSSVTKDFFIETLGWSNEIWDFDNININLDLLPVLISTDPIQP